MISSINEKNYKSVYTNGVIEGLSDAPSEIGGEGDAFTPFELLEASLASCICITIRKYAEYHNFSVEKIDVKIHIDDSDAQNPIIEKTINLTGDLTEEERNKILKVSESCKVGKLLSKGFSFKNNAL